ncbi:TraV family lipoprotein [Banduia mediterranea]|uniref:TraV family lipoprotein n=1 Tax=Banduia mediterranea TaxID=3075609 RepID=UPI003D77CEA0
MKILFAILVASATLLGCSTTPKYSCGAPISSGGCRSVSRIHAAATGQAEPLQAPDIAGTTQPTTSGHGEPSLSAPRVLRINVLPYVDGEGDFHDAASVYVRIGNSEWMVENLR